MKRAVKHGAAIGLILGFLALGATLLVVGRCLPFRISLPAAPWPWYCNDPVYGAVTFLAFPVNLLTNDLAQAVFLAPLTLMVYVLVGALIGHVLGTVRASPSRD